ncbi:hypothetical protein STTU_1246 [Streptomyces sp. Tu6071]|nr:hypothetical protein STTU_1246 [Streptomyces sp. Tu6071]
MPTAGGGRGDRLRHAPIRTAMPHPGTALRGRRAGRGWEGQGYGRVAGAGGRVRGAEGVGERVAEVRGCSCRAVTARRA